MIDLPGTTGGATPAFLTDALRAGGLFGDAVSVIEVDHEQMAVGVAMSGQLGRLRPVYAPSPAAACAPATLVFKLPSTAPDNRAVGTTFRLYEREARFYADLAEHVPIRTPRRYWAQVGPEDGLAGLLLEDLGAWTTPSQIAGADPDQARRAITVLADLHASRWDSTTLDCLGWLPRLDQPTHLPFGQMYRDVWPSFIERFGDLLAPEALDLGRGVQPVFEDLLHAATHEAPSTLCHGDFRLDNLMFDTPTGAVAAVDWQLVHRGPAVEDLAMFLAQSLDVDTRRRHERTLVHAWYDRLAATTAAEMSYYPFDRAWDHYRRMTLFTTVYPVVVAGSMDLANARGRDLLVNMAIRSFTAAVDLGAGQFLT